MADKYEYHKQNDYPGERVAERKRVSDRKEAANDRSNARVAEKGRTEGLKADARVARRGRMDDELMDSEIERSSARAARINKRRNSADAIGLVVIAGLVVILMVGSIWGFMTIEKQSSEINNLNSQLDQANSDNYQLSAANRQLGGITDTNSPTILYLSPMNSASPSPNETSVGTRDQITVMFSKDMDPSTINANTFTVVQTTRTDAGGFRSLPIDGVITYSDRKATFVLNERLQPNQQYGNVFTVTITKGAKDFAGNSLANDYVWSFTTGGDPFRIIVPATA